ncbi:MAG: heme exporter protein CcmB [Candidatus Bathyarchaeia archaeon]
MKAVLRSALHLAEKDLVVEFRRIYELLSIVTFALSSILIVSFALRGAVTLTPEVISAALWIVVFFSSILLLTTSFAREVDKGTIAGLRSLPIPPYTILLGKILYSGAILLFVVAVTFLSSVMFLNLSTGVLAKLAAVFLVGVLDLALVGSVVSALVMYSEGKTLLLSFLFFPVSVPVLIPSTMATEKIIGGMTFLDAVPELRLLLAFMLAVTAVSILLFRYVFVE